MDIRNPRLDEYINLPERVYKLFVFQGFEKWRPYRQVWRIWGFYIPAGVIPPTGRVVDEQVDTLFQTLKHNMIILLWHGSCQFSDRYLLIAMRILYLCGSCQLFGKKTHAEYSNSLYQEQIAKHVYCFFNDSRTQLRVMVMVMVTATKPENPTQHL
jgi:hypothetical protein